MIRNCDGTPYCLQGEIKAYQPNGKSQTLFNKYDAEVIKMSGSPIYYYEILIQIQTIDDLYQEDRGRLFSDCPVKLYAYYEPPQQQTNSSMIGIDVPDEEAIFELNYEATKNCLGGKEPKMGSRIYTPHRGENWVVLDRRLESFKLWGALRLLLHCRKFQETSTAANQ